MNIEKNKNYTLIKPTENSVQKLIIELKKAALKINNEHLIIDFSEYFNIKVEEFLLFLNLSKDYKKKGTSFVIVSKSVETDEIPEEIIIVPTVNEALDILEMDAIERDLGF
jgi:hypothetical protein